MAYIKRYKPQDIRGGKCPECKSGLFLYSKGAVTCRNCGYKIGKQFSKYGAKKQEYNGNMYDSKFEAGTAEYYDTLLLANEIKQVQRQVRIPLEAYGKHIFNYIIDFIIIHNDGHKEYVEAKGYETDLWKAKWKMLEGKLEKEDPTAEMTLLKQGKMPMKKLFKK